MRSQPDLRFTNYDGSSLMYSIRSLGSRSFSYTLPRENQVVTVQIEQVRQVGATHPQRCHLLNIMFKKLVLQHSVEFWKGQNCTLWYWLDGMEHGLPSEVQTHLCFISFWRVFWKTCSSPLEYCDAAHLHINSRSSWIWKYIFWIIGWSYVF